MKGGEAVKEQSEKQEGILLEVCKWTELPVFKQIILKVCIGTLGTYLKARFHILGRSQKLYVK